MNDFESIIKELLQNDVYKKDIEKAIVDKIKESINYNLSNKIYDIVNKHFDKLFAADIEQQIERASDYIRDTLLTTIQNKIKECADSIEFEPYAWALKELIKDGIKINDNK